MATLEIRQFKRHKSILKNKKICFQKGVMPFNFIG